MSARVETAAAALLFAGVALLVPGATGVLGAWSPDPGRWPRMLAALAVPAFAEELVFRGPLLRWRSRALAAALLAAYVAWHPLAAALWRPEFVPLFTSPAFLFLTALLGGVALTLTLRHRRLWPAVVLHWLAVAGWLLFWGGPSV
ncbi:CPBP family glutamic-type intramembrane protease [Histidinibacterium aquaticum]|uniref:CPBP family intramembrane metalloprotease n=1 Tax=Histidinibacterium aquaticum TaxID=2613962 RepID=A0A5J5GSB1_9RHOB|nr:CPBP family glutamic-type intramembrane protease [Histidinibacterium aquaticum]KAA9010553.1 CPBP family intramembrane metalloprotease [Histidinibacterium aquaticum]